MSIKFTQYLLPHGRRRETEIKRPAEIEEIAQRFIKSGGRYECEILTTGDVSITAVKEIDGEEGDVVIEICPNEPGKVGAATDKVVRQSEAYA